MADMGTRQDIAGVVARGLARREFAERFEAFGPDEDRVILVALLEDRLSDLCSEVQAVGGAANVVAPVFDGLICFVMRPGNVGGTVSDGDLAPLLDGDCTVGVMIARLMEDGGSGDYQIRTGTCGAEVAERPRILQQV